MTTPKKQVITWPIATIVLAVIATLAGLFAPLISGFTENKEDLEKPEIITALSTNHLKRLEKNLDDLRAETRQQYKYVREDFKFIKEELREIKKQLRKK